MEATLNAAVLRLLTPLVRYLIGQGCTYPALSDLLKSIYVNQAQSHYGATPGRNLTDSRISLLTGIHRKDVKRLRGELAGTVDSGLRREANLAARVVAEWVSAAKYLTPEGEPRALPLRLSTEGPSFESLVREAKADLRPRAVLDELVRVGVAEIDMTNRVKLLRTAYVSALPADKLAFLGDNVGDHIQSALHNIEQPQVLPYLERAVYYDAVPTAALTQLRPTLQRLGDQLLRQANRHLTTLVGSTSATPRRRMRLGVYYYEDDAKEDHVTPS